MAFQILINIGVAFVWILLQNEYTAVQFVIGYMIGLGVLFVLRRFIGGRFYFSRVIAFVKLIFIFIWELILANIDMVKIVLRPRMDITPGIVAVPTKLRSDWEISLLAALISLTPGTLSMVFSDEGDVLYVHSVHVPDKQEMIDNIIETFENAIMEVTN